MSSTLTLPSVPFEQFTLANGLRVVLSEDHAVPVVSVAVYYDVGSRNEREGRTGFAHLFEHMMFQGSENVPKAGHFQYIFNNGGTMNGTTSSERTNYFETLPANQLPLALWLESDRMRSLKVTQENLDNQRDAVKEEKRLNYDNRPYSNAFLRLNELIYRNPANAHSTIGSMEDLDDATIEDIREFFRIYYAPNNAVLTIVGDFDPAVARELVEKYFASIPAQPAPPPVDVDEPAEVAARHEIYRDPFAQLPAMMIGWKAPARRTDDFYALALASDLLLEGDSSRFYQRLVKGDESVIGIQGGMGERRGPSSLYIFAIPKPGHSTEEIRRSINDELERLATEGPSEEEMEKLRNTMLNDAVRGRQSTLYRAQRLAEYALYDGDPHFLNTELERYLSVTPAEIKEATRRYLLTDNQVLMEVVPSHAPVEEAPAPSAATQAADEPAQPGAPPPQVPAPPPADAPPPTSAPLPSELPTPPKPESPPTPQPPPSADEPVAK
ncbi:MAG TPA: pitrilysin family protein [Pyrinomonadaceae bacterium]|nr:pitrilysin family protein [Pyrinomonadaceae bacterium]